MPFILPDLPYSHSALEPHLSAETLRIHHGKHHAGYVNTVNAIVAQSNLKSESLEEIIANAAGDALFNAAAQAWNHTFYWSSMTPGGGGKPSGALARHIDDDFGGFDVFTEQFTAAAMGQFGSGWAWLVHDKGRLKVRRTPNAETPLRDDETPLLTIDVWEHAYYVDYRNDRRTYVDTFLSALVNWEFASRNLESALAGKRPSIPPVWALA